MANSRAIEHEYLEDWCRDYILSSDLEYKLNPPPMPESWHNGPSEVPSAPGRPGDWQLATRSSRAPSDEGIKQASVRARLMHTFFYHELQAAELMCWVALRFWDSELEFRTGLLGICQDEIRHMKLYIEHINRLGMSMGTIPYRNWFWDRVPSCPTPSSFVALMGMSFEAANLEHAESFAQRFAEVGDDRGAEIQRIIAREEIPHVRFATFWFSKWNPNYDFKIWRAALPEPLTPTIAKGKQLARAARLRSGLSEEFLNDLDAWDPASEGRQ